MAIFLWYGYEKSLLERGQALLDAGFSSASLWWEEEMGRSPLENLASLRDMGLEMIHAHLPFHPDLRLWGSDEKRSSFEKQMIRWIEELHKAELPLAVFHPWVREEMEITSFDKGLESFERIISRAQELGIHLAAENLWKDDALFVLLDHFSSLEICLDTGHLGVSGNWEKIKPYLHRVSAVHLHDNDQKSDLHLIPGDGILPLYEWFQEIPEVSLHLEVSKLLSPLYAKIEERKFLERARISLERFR